MLPALTPSRGGQGGGGQWDVIVRRLAVPDLTTTVLTLTVTGLVADTTPDQYAAGD
jgi:hypothetical protein